MRDVAMTIANEAPSKQKLAIRPRPPLGLGAAMIGKEEEELVLQVLRNQEPFRYYGHDANHPPGMAAQLEKEFGEVWVQVRAGGDERDGRSAMRACRARR